MAFFSSINADDVRVSSPDGNLVVTVNCQNGVVSYSATLFNKPVIERSAMGLKTSVGNFTQSLQLLDHETVAVHNKYQMRGTKASGNDYEANRLTLNFRDRDGLGFGIIFQVSNSDIAFKYAIPRQKYSGKEFNSAVSEFTVQCPDVTVEVTHGNHDTLYALLRNGELDIVLNDQRRAFSDEYVNIVLDIREYYAEISVNSPLAQLDEVEISDLKNTPLILLSSPDQQETERSFYANDLGFTSQIYFTEYIDDALMQVIQGKGFMPIEGSGDAVQTTTKAVRLLRNGKPIIRRYCAFMKADNPKKHTNEFIEILKKQF